MKKTNNKIEFRILANNALIGRISDIMSRMDLGISKVEKSEYYNCSWKTTATISKEYITKMRKQLKQGFSQQGYEVLSIRRIK